MPRNREEVYDLQGSMGGERALRQEACDIYAERESRGPMMLSECKHDQTNAQLEKDLERPLDCCCNFCRQCKIVDWKRVVNRGRCHQIIVDWSAHMLILRSQKKKERKISMVDMPS